MRLGHSRVTPVAGGRTPGARAVRVVWDPPQLFAAVVTMPQSSAQPAEKPAGHGHRHRRRRRRERSRSEASSSPRASGAQLVLRSKSPLRKSRDSKERRSKKESQPGPKRPMTPPRMDPELRGLLVGQPDLMGRLFRHVGVETCQDVMSLWPASIDLVRELETFGGGGEMSADSAMAAGAFLNVLRRRAKEAHVALVKDLVSERSSSCRTRAIREEVAVSPPRAATTKIRRLLGVASPGPPPTKLALAEKDPHVKEEMQKQTKLDVFFQLAVEDVVDLQELGVTLEELEDPVKLQSTKDALTASAARLSAQRLSALVSAFRRWRRFAIARGWSVRAPTPVQMSEFLREVAIGGPTAASSQWQVLHWWEVNLGCHLHTSHFLVQPFRFQQVAHTSKQAAELHPWEFFNLMVWCRTLEGTHKLLVGFLLLSAVSCVRYEHLQRSHYVKEGNGFLEFWCSQGKSRRQGSRPGYSWCMPDVEYQGFSLMALIRDFCVNESMSKEFLIPAIELSVDDLWEITPATPFILNRPMSRGRFLEVLRGSLLHVGNEPRTAAAALYNKLRRFLPTAANVCHLDPIDLQAVGNWVDIPAGGHRDPGSKKPQAVNEMGLHYGAAKVIRSFVVKSFLLRRIFRLYHAKVGELALTEKGYLTPDSWTWEEFAGQHMAVGWLPIDRLMHPQPLVDGFRESDLQVCPAEPVLPVPVDPAGEAAGVDYGGDEPADEAGESSSDLSFSASDLSADPTDLVNMVPDEEILTELAWFKQGSKVHVVREKNEDQRNAPWCRDFPFVQEAKEYGSGLGGLTLDAVCQKCLARMPRSTYCALADIAGWAH